VKGKAGTRGKHAIMAFPREPGMATTIQNWKKLGAGKYSADWQRDFFDHRLRDHHKVEEKTSYILMKSGSQRSV
jgi:putative transposase